MTTPLILTPPYRDFTVPDDGPCGPPLGAIALYAADFDPAVAARAHERWPWCVPCLRLDPGSERSAVEFVHATGAHPGLIVGAGSRCLPPVGDVLRAVAERAEPGVDALVGYVVRRLDCHAEHDALTLALGEPRGGVPGLTPRTVRRRLAALGRYRPWEWRRLATLALLADRAALPVDRLASRAGTEPRTLRVWVRHLLGTSLAAFRARVGWEWVIEAGLRRSRPSLAPAPPPSRSAPNDRRRVRPAPRRGTPALPPVGAAST